MKAARIPAIAASLLGYCPETGKLWWLESRNGYVPAGTEAGRIENGRRRIGLDGKSYLAHRVAYFLHTGRQPPPFLDHADGNPSNNRFKNLRPATRRQNNRNKGTYRNNTTGIKGVVVCRKSGKFRARIGIDGKKVCLGRFDTAQEAAMAYEAAAKRAYGEFFRPN